MPDLNELDDEFLNGVLGLPQGADETVAMNDPGASAPALTLTNRAPATSPVTAPASTNDDSTGSLEMTVPSQPSDPNDVKTLIASKYGFGPGLDNAALASAQQLALKNKAAANEGDAFATIANALAGSNQKPDDQFFENVGAQGSQPVQDILQQRQAAIQGANFANQQEDLDPNSVKAAIMRKQLAPLAQKVGLDPAALNNLGVTDLKNFSTGPMEFAARLKQQEENNRNNLEMRRLMFENQQSEKNSKDAQAMGDALDPDKSRAGNFGQQQQIVYASNKINALAKQFPDGNLPPAQVAELAQATAMMLSNNSGAAEGTVNRYVPSSVGRDVAGLTQWLTGKPNGAEQQGFVKQMLETAQREGNLAQQNVNQIKFSRVSQFDRLRQRDPDTWAQVLESHGVDPAAYDAYQKNGYKMPSPAAAAPTSPVGFDQSGLEAEMRKRRILP